jgi:GntR family transcriptional regulator
VQPHLLEEYALAKLIRNSPTAMYVQLCDLIKKQIASKGIRPGSPLPSETDLMTQYGVSRTTVRLAVDSLVRTGVAVRVQGKGTFVAGPTIRQELSSLQALSESLIDVGLDPRVSVIDLGMNPVVPPHALAQLNLESGSGVICLRRLHTVDEAPVVFAVIYLSSRFQWRFSSSDLTQRSIYSWLKEEESISVGSIVHSISATIADDEVAPRLGLRPGDPVLHVQNTGIAGSGIPIDYSDLYFPPDRYALTTKLNLLDNGVSIASMRVDSQANGKIPILEGNEQ